MGALSPKTVGGTPVTIHVYVESADAAFDAAVAAGAVETGVGRARRGTSTPCDE